MKPPRWMIRRDLKDQGFDPMLLPRGSQRCWCSECGLYFNSSYAFEKHRVTTEDPSEKRCLTVAELRSSRWSQGPKGHWLSPQKGVGKASSHGRIAR